TTTQYFIAHLPQSGLTHDARPGSSRQIVAGFTGNRDSSALRWVLELAMTSSRRDQAPAVLLYRADSVANCGHCNSGKISHRDTSRFKDHTARSPMRLIRFGRPTPVMLRA